MKDKAFKIIIGILILAIIITFVILLLSKNEKKYTFYLQGNDIINIYQGDSFEDPGFIATDIDGNDASNLVKVDSSVDINTIGKYTISYTLGNKVLTREVEVIENPIVNKEIILNGENPCYILKGETYNEMGSYVYNKLTNQNDDIAVSIEGNVDTNTIGKYEIVYSITENNKTKSVKREINVYEFEILYNLSPNDNTVGDVNINLIIDNQNGMYAYTVLPNNNITKELNIKYPVSENNTYKFIIYDNHNAKIEKEIKVENIINDITCNGEITSTGTKLNVSSSKLSNISSYSWDIDGKIISGNSSLNIEKSVSNASVSVHMGSSDILVNCTIKDSLLYHFKYDEDFSKPFMKCNTYTSEDKIKYDDILSKSINQAGFGTRAGVVAAARFLVGGLDYKVPYLGPKTVNTALGRYKKKGLNIGQNGAWGCSVSGWTQGMDCTNFVDWALYQNDLSYGLYSTTDTYKVRDVIEKVKPGDFFLCPSSDPNKTFQHIGMVIGIDENYFYVAESTTGSINAIVTKKYEKNNMPTGNGKFSVVRLVNYPSDGNLTMMWM